MLFWSLVKNVSFCPRLCTAPQLPCTVRGEGKAVGCCLKYCYGSCPRVSCEAFISSLASLWLAEQLKAVNTTMFHLAVKLGDIPSLF